MATVEEISAAFNLIDDKKQNLHKSFLHLQSQSPSSLNLPLNWADLDSYFTTLQSSLHSKFNLLQTILPSSEPTTVPARPELKALCENSDGLGLIRFIALAPDQPSILSELPDAYRCAPDAPAMVLDAAASFYSPGFKGIGTWSLWNGCLCLLEGLLRVKIDVTIEMKDKAMQMAVRWNRKVSRSGRVKSKFQKVLGFLLLLEAYGLVDRFSIDEIINCVLIVSMNDKTIDMCRRIIPANSINNLIQKLIDTDRYPTAVKFIIQLKKTDEFPPFDLLEEWKLRSMSVIEETRRNEKDLGVGNAVILKEIRALNSIIRCVDENCLESEYPKDSLVELVNKAKSYMSKKSKRRKRNKTRLTAECPSSDPTTVPARPELKSFCENSDLLGLIRFIALAPDRQRIPSELPDAYRCAPDAPAMVLDAATSFYSPGYTGAELQSFWNGCLIILEGLVCVKLDITIEMKDKAMEIAVQWIRKIVSLSARVEAKKQKALGFLLFVEAYGLVDRFSIDEIIDCFLIIPKNFQTIELCQRIIPANKINDMIQKLIDKDRYPAAVKFIIQLEKTDEFPAVGLLEDRKLKSVRVIEETRRNTKDLHVIYAVTMKEIRVLKSIIICIDENHLESEYPKDSVVKLVNKLKNEVGNSKQQLVNDPGSREQEVRATVIQNVKTIQEFRSQKSDLLPECHSSPLRSSNVSFAKESVVELVNKLDNEMENSKQTFVNDKLENEVENSKQTYLGLRKQPVRATVLKGQLLLKSKMSKKTKKPKVNKVQPTAIVTPVQNTTSIQESHLQILDLSPDHVSECHVSPLEFGSTGFNASSARDSTVEVVNDPANESENSKVTLVEDPESKEQPVRTTVLKRQLLLKSKMSEQSKKQKLNMVQPTAEQALATPVQNVQLIQESRSQKSNLLPAHVGECNSSPPGSSPTGSIAPSESPIGSTRPDIDYSFYVPQLYPPSGHKSNGWISD